MCLVDRRSISQADDIRDNLVYRAACSCESGQELEPRLVFRRPHVVLDLADPGLQDFLEGGNQLFDLIHRTKQH